eukprot:SAG22_NODE_19_length_32182_cov_39.206963_3_plen_43_part_00
MQNPALCWWLTLEIVLLCCGALVLSAQVVLIVGGVFFMYFLR